MKVKELVEILTGMDQESAVIVRQGKHGFAEAVPEQVVAGYFMEMAGDFREDMDDEGGTDSVLIGS